MKTILIVLAGMGDLPDTDSKRETPLFVGHIPSMDTLAQRGDLTAFPSIEKRHPLTHKNALLSIMGYDLDKGEPNTEELREFGLDRNGTITDYPSLRPFVIPGFSGHGVCITTSAWVRGVAKCAMLRPLDIYSPGAGEEEILDTIAQLAREAIADNEFIFIYVDTPLKASLAGDYDGKIKILERIDRHLVAPIADFAWKSEKMINLAITTDLITPWYARKPMRLRVPVIFYYNNHDWDGDPELNFTEIQAMMSRKHLDYPSDMIRYLINFSADEDEEIELPF